MFPQRLGQSPAVCFHRAVTGLGLGLGLGWCSWDVSWVSEDQALGKNRVSLEAASGADG